MKPFEEKYAAWVDGTLTGRELEELVTAYEALREYVRASRVLWAGWHDGAGQEYATLGRAQSDALAAMLAIFPEQEPTNG